MSRRASRRPAADLGVNASIINPTTDDPAEQVRAIEDLIAKKVDVIGVIPNDGKALEPVLGRAQAAGIKVVMNESPGPEERRLGHRADPGQGVRRGPSGSLRRGDRRRRQIRPLCRRAHRHAAQSVGRLRGRAAEEEISEDAADRRPLRRLEQRRGQLQDRDRPDAGQPGPQGLPDLRRQRPDRRRPGGGRPREDRQGHRRRSVHPEPGPEADEGRAPSRAASCGTRSIPAMPWSRSARCWRRAARSRTAWTCRAWGRCRSNADTRVIRANKQIDLNPESIDEWAKII